MKLVYTLFLSCLIINSCSNYKILNIDRKGIDLKEKIVKMYKSENSYIFLTDSNNIIESSLVNIESLRCTKVSVGDVVSFQVVPVSGMYQEGAKLYKVFDVNDTLTIHYKELYFAKKVRKYCP